MENMMEEKLNSKDKPFDVVASMPEFELQHLVPFNIDELNILKELVFEDLKVLCKLYEENPEADLLKQIRHEDIMLMRIISFINSKSNLDISASCIIEKNGKLCRLVVLNIKKLYLVDYCNIDEYPYSIQFNSSDTAQYHNNYNSAMDQFISIIKGDNHADEEGNRVKNAMNPLEYAFTRDYSNFPTGVVWRENKLTRHTKNRKRIKRL